MPSPTPAPTKPELVVSQLYGGAGCTTAGCSSYRNDFIEIFNRGASPVSLGGWSVQYSAATGTTWQVTSLPNVTLQPGQYYLVQQAGNANGTSPLPAPDANGTINMSATAGKVALVSSTGALSGACPAADAALVDLVGYGTTANCFEGGGRAPTPGTTVSAARRAGGCQDTQNNAADFQSNDFASAASVPPRNASSPTNICQVGSASASGAREFVSGLVSELSALEVFGRLSARRP